MPWHQVRPSSMTFASVESIISGTLTMRIAVRGSALTSAISSRSGSWRQTSRICAPLLTCARPISAAASKLPGAISRLNLRLPSTLVRSPTSTGRLSSSASTSSMPGDQRLRVDRRAARLPALGRRRERADVGRRRAAAAADEVEPAGVQEAAEHARRSLGRLRVVAVLVGQARRSGSRRSASCEIAERLRMWSVMNSGPVAQLRPT